MRSRLAAPTTTTNDLLLRLILLGAHVTGGRYQGLLALVLLPGREDEALNGEPHEEVEVGAVCCVVSCRVVWFGVCVCECVRQVGFRVGGSRVPGGVFGCSVTCRGKVRLDQDWARTHGHPAVEQGPALARAGVAELDLVVGGGECDEDAGKHLCGVWVWSCQVGGRVNVS